METATYNNWKEPVIENDYRNIEALAEITVDLAARLETLIDGYNEDHVSETQIQEVMALGRRALEAEEKFRPRFDTGYTSLAEEIDTETSNEYVDLEETAVTQQVLNPDDVEKFLIKNSPEAERKLENAQQNYIEQLDRAVKELSIDSIQP